MPHRPAGHVHGIPRLKQELLHPSPALHRRLRQPTAGGGAQSAGPGQNRQAVPESGDGAQLAGAHVPLHVDRSGRQHAPRGLRLFALSPPTSSSGGRKAADVCPLLRALQAGNAQGRAAHLPTSAGGTAELEGLHPAAAGHGLCSSHDRLRGPVRQRLPPRRLRQQVPGGRSPGGGMCAGGDPLLHLPGAVRGHGCMPLHAGQ
mmetsp:Transcript_98611/g.234901  ORF Transcript_98611/g.234901 Transcript_98611/m.234901 type:complete len:203 (+) Transcript_98611:156-764(+)